MGSFGLDGGGSLKLAEDSPAFSCSWEGSGLGGSSFDSFLEEDACSRSFPSLSEELEESFVSSSFSLINEPYDRALSLALSSLELADSFASSGVWPAERGTGSSRFAEEAIFSSFFE